MATKQVTVKVYHLEKGVNKEIRKFSLEEDVATNYVYLMEKVKFFFSSLVDKDILLYYKDDEGDYVSISSDIELFELLKNVCDGNLKLYVEVKNGNTELNRIHHPGVLCDGCDGPINGIRYKCTVCPDFDLCSSCEGEQNHPLNHDMLCVKAPHRKMKRFQGRCPWSPMKNKPVFTHRYNYPSPQFPKGACSKENKRPCKERCGTIYKELIEQMAFTFGFDPDVAISQAQSYLDHLQPEYKVECDGKDIPQPTEKMDGVPSTDINNDAPKAEGNNDNDDVPKAGSNVSSQPENVKCNNEVNEEIVIVDEKESVSSKSKNTCEDSKNDFTDIAKPILTQLGIAPDDEQLKNLGQVISSVIENMGTHFNLPPSDDKTDTTELTENTCPDEAIVLDDKNKETEKSEQELFDERLAMSLSQMEAMGFDNECDWLKQLLIAKDLDISKVLDALNPPR